MKFISASLIITLNLKPVLRMVSYPLGFLSIDD